MGTFLETVKRTLIPELTKYLYMVIGSVAKWIFWRSPATSFLTGPRRLLCSGTERWPVQPTSTPATPSPKMGKFGSGSVFLRHPPEAQQ